jgi:hypothetical protein
MKLIDFENFCYFINHNFKINFEFEIFVKEHTWLCQTDFKQYQFTGCQTYY